MNRRLFLTQSALGFFSFGLAPTLFGNSFLRTALAGIQSVNPGKILVIIFQRGACDGLSMVAPLMDSHYRELRPHIAIPERGNGAALRLDGNFGLHPALASLKHYWDEGTLSIVHQVGSPDSTRSHFDAQDYMESGTPGVKTTGDGYLNRSLQSLSRIGNMPLRAVALSDMLPRSLHGPYPAVSMNSIHDFGFRGNLAKPQLVQGFENMYEQAADHVFRGAGDEVFSALKSVEGAEANRKESKNEDLYPKAAIGRRLREIATLIKARVGLQIAATDCGGWDTHVNQGDGERGQLKDRLKELGDSMSAFAKDLGPFYQDVVLVTMTEFGRTVKENGNHGTDHGHGSVMMVLGGAVQGKTVHAHWKDLSSAHLQEGRDLPVTTDYREVMSGLLQSQLGVQDFSKVFPGWKNPPLRLLRS